MHRVDRPRPRPTSSPSTSRPRPRSSATSPSATRFTACGVAPGRGADARRASRSTSPRGLEALARGRHGARPRAAARAVAAAARGARRAARRPRPRRARGLDLHRRLRARRTPACSTAAGPRRTGRTPTQLAERYPAVTVDPDVLYVDEGDVLTSAGVAAGIDLCLHLVRRDHGAEVANAVARRIVVAPHRDGGQAQFVERAAARGGRARAGAPRAPGRSSACASRSPSPRWRATPRCSERTFARRFRAETGTTPLQWLLRPARPARPPPAGGHRPPGRGRRRPRRLRHGRLAALALPPRDGHDAARVSPQLQG